MRQLEIARPKDCKHAAIIISTSFRRQILLHVELTKTKVRLLREKYKVKIRLEK